MKQIYLLLAVFCHAVLLSQTVLTSYPLSLGKNLKSAQILTAPNSLTHEVFVFARTENELTVLKYNNALFLKDKATFSSKYTEDKILIGYSFSNDGNPTLYWSSQDGGNIIIIKYYLENKTSKAMQFLFPLTTQTLSAEYESNNSFYLIAQSKSESKLIVYIFKNGLVEQKELDFSSFVFKNSNMTRKNFLQILKENKMEKMEANEYNSIYKANSKIKIYPLEDRLILSLDHNIKNTQLFDIDLNTLEIKEKNFAQPISKKKPETSNSFYYENKLFQINTNKEEFLFQIKDYDSQEIIKKFDVTKNDTIRFKNSPFQIQRNNFALKEIKNTAKFLKQLSTTNVGLSVFDNNKNIFITIGGISSKEYQETFNGFVVTQEYFTGIDEYGDPYNTSHYFENTMSVFFESIWDKNFDLTPNMQEPLATDKIYLFIDKNKEVRMQSIVKFKDYFILGYYDLKTKAYILRKFTDGYNENMDFPKLKP